MESKKTALINAMENYFNSDVKRIDHAHRVTKYAEELLETEGGDYSIVLAAAVLHDIGIHEAERKYNSTSGKYQEKEGPPIARDILAKLGFEQKEIDEICSIIAHHHSPGKITTQNFKVLYDSDWLVNLNDEYNIQDSVKLNNIVERVFLTQSGKRKAKEIYL